MTSTTESLSAHSGQPFTNGVVHGTPKLLLLMEGAAALAASAYAYGHSGSGWGLFALLFLVPDMSMLGYLANPRIGASIYNLGHSYLTPAALALLGLTVGTPMLVSVALIWIAHIGFDRAVGYGFKYPTAFKHTHLGLPFSQPRAARGLPLA
jgi:hypothetical protein